nr:hypothetical protein [Solirubrobacterales bacterium]
MTGVTQPGPGCGGRGADNAGVSDLLSKLLAGGLSAGLLLLWWPHHFPTTGLEWLVLRGVAWTLAFEVLLLAFRPLERLAWSRAHASVTTRAPRVRAALGVGVTPRAGRPGPAVALALTAFAVPA